MDMDGWRRKIDEIDDDLMELLTQRAEIARRISRMKKAGGVPLDDPERENIILDRLIGKNRGPLTGGSVKRIFSLIINEIKNMNQGEKR